MMIVFSLLIIFYYICIQAANSNSKRNYLKPLSLFILLLSSAYVFGFLIENIWGFVAVAAISLHDFYSQRKPFELFVMAIIQVLVVLFIAFGYKFVEMLMLVPIALMFLVPLFSKKVSHIQIFQLALGFIGVFTYSVISFESLNILNPSFILPETNIPSEYFYDDFKAPLLSASVFILGFALLGLSKNERYSSPLLLVFMATICSMVKGLELAFFNIEDSAELVQIIIIGALVTYLKINEKKCIEQNLLVIIWGLFLVSLGSKINTLEVLVLMASMVFLTTSFMQTLFKIEITHLILSHIKQVGIAVFCFYGAFLSKTPVLSYFLFIVTLVIYLVFCYEKHANEESS